MAWWHAEKGWRSNRSKKITSLLVVLNIVLRECWPSTNNYWILFTWYHDIMMFNIGDRNPKRMENPNNTIWMLKVHHLYHHYNILMIHMIAHYNKKLLNAYLYLWSDHRKMYFLLYNHNCICTIIINAFAAPPLPLRDVFSTSQEYLARWNYLFWDRTKNQNI